MYKKTNWILFIALAMGLILLRFPSYELPLDPDSGANAFLARQMLHGTALYGKYHTTHHLPAIYYTFALAFKLFGDNLLAPKLFLFPWALACALLIYFMGRSLFDEQTGILGSIFFVLLSSQQSVTGMTVEMEHFANLPLIACSFLAVFLLRKEAPSWQFIWVGILGAICFLYKVIFVAPLIVAGISIILRALIARNEPGVWKTMVYRLGWLAVGLIIPLAFVAGYFASIGLWERFLLVFKFGSRYFNDPNQMGSFRMLRPFGFPLVWLGVNNIALLLFGLIATYRLARRSIPLRNMDHLTELSLVLWLIASLALAGLRGGGYAYYVLPAVPPLALMGAVEISSAYRNLRTASSEKWAIWGRNAMIFLVVINFLWGNYILYDGYIRYKLGNISHGEFHESVDDDEFAFNEIGNYIRAHTSKDDLIYIWGIHVEVYYYTDRLPPIDLLWPSYVSATGSPERIFDPRTRYIVVDKPGKIDHPQWLMDGLAASYELETIIEGREIYRRVQ